MAYVYDGHDWHESRTTRKTAAATFSIGMRDLCYFVCCICRLSWLVGLYCMVISEGQRVVLLRSIASFAHNNIQEYVWAWDGDCRTKSSVDTK